MLRSVRRLTSPRLGRAGLLAVLGLAGCSGLDPVATYDPITDAAQLFATLQLNHHAIVLSTDPAYNTIQLTATPFNMRGEAMAGLPAPTFTSPDTTVATVTPDGLVHALNVANETYVVAELRTGDNVRHVDTAFIKVTDLTSPPEAASVSLDPQLPDSAFWPVAFIGSSGLGGAIAFFSGLVPLMGLNPHPLSTTGDPISASDLLFSYKSLNPQISRIDPTTGYPYPNNLGRVDFAVETTAYGITKADTATYTMIPPMFGEINITDTGFEPSRAIAAKNAIITWRGQVPVLMDVTFDDPTNVGLPPDAVCNNGWGFLQLIFGFQPDAYCGAGNTGTFTGADGTQANAQAPDGTAGARTRQFPVPGVYTFHNTFTGATGMIEVVDY